MCELLRAYIILCTEVNYKSKICNRKGGGVRNSGRFNLEGLRQLRRLLGLGSVLS